MTPSQIVSALRSLLAIRQPAFLWGPPGVGKSQVVAQVARQNGLALRDIRAVLLDPVDLRGLPRISADGRSVWCPPAFLPGPADPERGIVFLDELNAAPPLVQAACYQLVLDRAIGEYRLPDGWSIVAAGNREGDRAVAYRMPSALANRMVHLDFTPDLEDWLRRFKGGLVMVTHDLQNALKYATHILHAGHKGWFFGTAAEFAASPYGKKLGGDGE